jgi:hypothetical protein
MSTTKSCIINIKKLNKVLLDLDDKYDINSGACALIASIIAQYLENNGIKYRTKVYYYEDNYEYAWHYSLVVDNIEINPSTYKYQNDEYIFENDCVVYKINEASGIVRFSNGSFIVDFGSAEILLSEIYMYLREKK